MTSTEPTERPTATPAAEPVAPSGGLGVYPGWRGDFQIQMVIAVLSVLAYNASRPIVTYQSLALGADPIGIGLVQSSFSLIPAFTAVAIGRIVDRGGEARYLAFAMAMFTVGFGLSGLAGSLALLAISQVIAGTGHIMNLVSSQAMVANRGPRAGREARFGTYSVAASIGHLAGPIIAGLLAGAAIGAGTGGGLAAGYELSDGATVLFVAAGATAIGFLFALQLVRRNRQAGVERIGRPETAEEQLGILAASKRVLRRPGMAEAMLVSITVISTVDVLIAYLPAYGDEVGLSVAVVGFLLSVRAAASLVSRVFMGRLIEAFGRERVLAGSMALSGISIGLVPLTNEVIILTALMAASGLGLGVGQPMTIAWVAQRSPRAERATALGVRLTGNRGALLVVPATMGVIAGAAGLVAIFLVLAFFLVLGAIVAARTPFEELVERGPGAGG